jgi:hypothetical protein
MEWHIEVHDEGSLVMLKVSGAATMEIMTQMAAETIEVARCHGISKFLIDGREMGFAVSDIVLYDLPGMAEEHGLLRTAQLAVVYSADSTQTETFQFLENIFVNRGFRLHSFADMDDALAWLNVSA